MFLHTEQKAMFIHIPKCGGKTVTEATDHGWKFFRVFDYDIGAGKKVPRGHPTYMDSIPYEESSRLWYSKLNDIDIITSLRDPVSWYASYYNYYWDTYELEVFESWRHKFINAGDGLALAGLRKTFNGGYSLKNIAQNYEKILQLDCGVMTKYFLSCVCDFSDTEAVLKITSPYDFYNFFCKADYIVNYAKSEINRQFNKSPGSGHWVESFTEKEKMTIRHNERLIFDILYKNTHEPKYREYCKLPLQQLPKTLNKKG